MKKIGFLGCGKIGGSLYRHITENGRGEVCFIQDPFWPAEKEAVCPVTDVADEMLYREADLVIECANSSVLRENIRSILKNCDLLMFSVTAFADREFEAQAKALCEEYGRHIYLPHGAILGLDGIFDGRRGIRDVFIETRKKSGEPGEFPAMREPLCLKGPPGRPAESFPAMSTSTRPSRWPASGWTGRGPGSSRIRRWIPTNTALPQRATDLPSGWRSAVLEKAR